MVLVNAMILEYNGQHYITPGFLLANYGADIPVLQVQRTWGTPATETFILHGQ